MGYHNIEKEVKNRDFHKELGTKVESDKVSEWYNRVIKEAGIVEQGPAKGTIVLRPYGYAIWKQVQKDLGADIENYGVQDAYFPAIIPESLLTKEKEHIEGFAPEFLRVHGRDGVVGVLRPTSEAAMYPLFSKWIHSYRDLPLELNQWCNVFRDELRTYAFIRTSEFLWQEGHCAYASAEENEEAVLKFLKMYEDFFRDTLALAPVFGKKSEKEKFAGAVYTTTGESLMPSGKVLQVCTSHNLGTNFSKPFKIQFLGKDGKEHYVHQTSWGLSWRAIGATIITHGDKKGIIFPPEIAPCQIVIVPIKGEATEQVIKTAEVVNKSLMGLRVETDDSDERPGARYNYHELRGVPLRVEIGPRDVKNNQVVVANRLTGEKNILPIENLKGAAQTILDSIQKDLLKRAEKLVQDNTHDVKTWDEFTEVLDAEQGFLRTYHCGQRECEQKIQDETKATIRCIPFRYEKSKGLCIKCGEPSDYGQKVLFAKAY